jgi:hypothetical protein
MADARAATTTAVAAWLADQGILIDGSDGFVDGTLNHNQLKEMFRVADTQGLQFQLASGVLKFTNTNVQSTDTSSG